jgi:predicted acyltransferase
MTIVGMILVNNPGNLKTTYWPLQHAEWHGWTPTDLVFPFFLFIVGVAIVLALKRRLDAGTSKRPLVMKVVKRSAIIFGLGLFLSGYPFGLFGPRGFGELVEVWRIPGVLQRIAICYLVVSLLVLFCRVRTLKILTVVFLVGYWALMTLVPVPGLGAPDIDDPGGHLSAWIDRAVFGDHVSASAKVYDPEGVLSTIPALGSLSRAASSSVSASSGVGSSRSTSRSGPARTRCSPPASPSAASPCACGSSIFVTTREPRCS